MLDSHNKMAKRFNKYFCIVVSKISGKNYSSVLMKHSMVSQLQLLT